MNFMSLNKFLEMSDKERSELQVLSLSAQNLGLLDADSFQAFARLSPCAGLKQLNLNYNNLDALDMDGFQALGYFLSRCPGLETLDLADNNLGALDARFQMFCDALANCPGLQTLNLGSNRLEVLKMNGFEALGQTLSRYPKLHTLQLTNNNLGELEAAGFQALGQTLSDCPRLHTLNLGSNRLQALKADGFQALGQALSRCRSLGTLNLENNNLDELEAVGFQALGQALSYCPRLHTLNLGSNNLGELEAAGFQALGQALSYCPRLQILNLGSNNLYELEADDFQALGQALSNCPALRTLSLWGNNLCDLKASDFQVFCDALFCLETLSEIENIAEFTKEQQGALTSILNKNLIFIEEIKNILESGLPNEPKFPGVLQNIMMGYLLPENALLPSDKTSVPALIFSISTPNSERQETKEIKDDPSFLIHLSCDSKAESKRGISPSAVDINDLEEGYTQLHHAISSNNLSLVTRLLERGANPDIRARATEEIIIRRGLSFDSTNRAELSFSHINDTALHTAVYGGNIEIVKLLLQYGANPSLRNNQGYTALQCAAQANRVEICRLLADRLSSATTASSSSSSFLSATDASSLSAQNDNNDNAGLTPATLIPEQRTEPAREFCKDFPKPPK